MAQWSKVQVGFHEDAAVAGLSCPAFKLFVVSFTHDSDASMTGLSRISERRLRRAIGVRDVASEQALSAALAELGDKPLVRYDFDHEVLWCVNRMRYAGRSPRWIKGAQIAVAKMPQTSQLVKQFRRRYGAVLNHNPNEV